MYGDTKARLQATLDEIAQAGLTKHERRLTSPQAAHISVSTGATSASFGLMIWAASAHQSRARAMQIGSSEPKRSAGGGPSPTGE